MAGDRPQWLAPSILVWCDAEDTKMRVRKLFDDEAWLEERMGIRGMNHYILDGPAYRSAKPSSLHSRSLCVLGGSSVIVPEHVSTSCGLSLILENGKKCDIGGLIFVDGTPYGMTTRHGLDDMARSLRCCQNVIRRKSVCTLPSTWSDVSPCVSTDGHKSASGRSSYTSITTPPSPKNPPQDKPEKLYHLALPSSTNSRDQVKVLCPPIPADEDYILEYPADDFDWVLIDLCDAPDALLFDLLMPNMVHGKPIQGLHLGEIDDQSKVTVLTDGLRPHSGLLSSVCSTLQVEGSLHDVRLIVLDKLLRA